MRTLFFWTLVAASAASCGRSDAPPAAPAAAPAPPAMRQVCVLPGEFLMGSPAVEPGRGADETSHPVRLTRPLWMDATEVTTEAWALVMGAGGEPRDCEEPCPVSRVSWYDALAYLNARSLRDGLEPCYVLDGCAGTPGAGCPDRGAECRDLFACEQVRFEGLDCPGWRLPTEAEWEYAARAGDSSPFPGGACITRAEAAFDGALPVEGCAPEAAGIDVVPAGSLPPNAWGLHELRGNLWEWVWDSYREHDAAAAVDPLGPGVGDHRIVRGGAYAFPMTSLRAGHRGKMNPARRSDMDGLRAVRTAGAPGDGACR